MIDTENSFGCLIMLETKETMAMNSRVELRTKARKLKGLMNLLADDIRNLNADAEDHDLLCLVVSTAE